MKTVNPIKVVISNKVRDLPSLCNQLHRQTSGDISLRSATFDMTAIFGRRFNPGKGATFINEKNTQNASKKLTDSNQEPHAWLFSASNKNDIVHACKLFPKDVLPPLKLRKRQQKQQVRPPSPAVNHC